MPDDIVRVPFTITGFYEVNRSDYAHEGVLPTDRQVFEAEQSAFEDGVYMADEIFEFASEYQFTVNPA